MAIRDEVDLLLKHIREQAPVIEHNKNLLCILEGDLMRFIKDHLARELKEQSLKDALPRIAPINFFKRIISKLSKIYQQSVQRRIVDGNERDDKLLEMYLQAMQMDCNMNVGNEYFNAFKTNLNQLFLNGDFDNGMGMPALRPIPNSMFYVYSTDMIDTTNPTHIIVPWGKERKHCGPRDDDFKMVDAFKVYTKDEISIIDADGEIKPDPVTMGINPFGLDQFMYVNGSNNFLNPPVDSDSFQMSVLLPVLISDLNYAVKYMAFSIVYGIDVDDANMVRSPNSFWALKSDPTQPENKPSIGQIKPQIDIQASMQLIISELSMWLNSRNIRPGSVSDVSAENMVSGISKLVDEMDTSDERKKQVERYAAAEEHFWNGKTGNSGVLHNIHPKWVANGTIHPSMRYMFSPNARVEISFPEQLPAMRRGQMITDLINEMNAGFVSRRTAMAKLNPEWTDARIEEEIEEIDSTGEVQVEDDEQSPQQTADENTQDETTEVIAGDSSENDEVEEKINKNGKTMASNSNNSIAKQSLNGAQVQSIVEVLNQVSAGLLPKDTAINLIVTAFAMTIDDAVSIVSPIELRGIAKEVIS